MIGRKQRSSVKRRWVWVLVALGYAAVFIAILVFAYLGKLPGFLTQNDKPAHFILYAIATFVGHRAFNRRSVSWGNLSFPAFPLGFALFTIVEELLQSLSPNRTLDSWDLIASLAGTLMGYGLAEIGRRKEI